jgi:transcriptional regulator GlxA family with amidase domain
MLAEMTKNPRIAPNVRIIEIAAFPGVQLLDVAGPLQVFASANSELQGRGKPPAYVLKVVSRSSPIASSSGLGLLSSPLCRSDSPIDTLLVAGGAGVHEAAADKVLVRWLATRAKMARRVASVCTGAFLLGAAGLLNGKRAVTHWNECSRLAQLYPKAYVERDPIFVQDGPLWSSAGVTAGIDLALAMIEADVGHSIAMAVARDLVVFLKRPGGQAQFSAAFVLQDKDSSFDRLNGWMADHLSKDLSVPALATQAGMSERTFVRRYRADVGFTPARAVEMLRVEATRQLLVGGKLPIKRIARQCGFGSEETMRRSFTRDVGITPRDYRARFSANLSTG